MSETPNDPAGTTHQFQNFASQAPTQQAKGVNVGLIVGIVLAVLLVVVVAIAIGMLL